MEGFKNRLYALDQREQSAVPYLKKNIVEAEGTLKLTVANLENSPDELAKINKVLDKAKADSKEIPLQRQKINLALEKEVKALQKEATDKAKSMEGRAKQLEKFMLI